MLTLYAAPNDAPSAAVHLRTLTGKLTTLTVVFLDGTALVRPTPPQLAEHP